MQGMRNDTGHGRVHTHHPLTQVRAGGSSKQSARRTMRAVSEMWCVIVGPIVICEHLCRFHAVAVSCCGGMLHLWSCVLDTCVGGRPRVAHTTDTKVSFRPASIVSEHRQHRLRPRSGDRGRRFLSRANAAESTRAAVKLPEQAARVLLWDARHLATRFVPTWVAKKSGTARSAGSKKTAKKIRYRYRPTR